MMVNEEQEAFAAAIKERFSLLPQVVQDAITSADMSKRLRELASKHQLHVDQWEALENEVQLTMLGLQPLEELGKNLTDELHIPFDVANPLAADISRIVFEPIRAELERLLEHPEAKEEVHSDIETAATQAIAGANPDTAAPGAAPTAAAPTAAPVTLQSSPEDAVMTAAAASAPATATPATPIATYSPVPPSASDTPPPAQPASTPIERAPKTATYAPGAASHERKSVEGDPYREQL